MTERQQRVLDLAKDIQDLRRIDGKMELISEIKIHFQLQHSKSATSVSGMAITEREKDLWKFLTPHILTAFEEYRSHLKKRIDEAEESLGYKP